MSVLIPADQLTLSEKARLRKNAVEGAIKRLVDLNIVPVQSAEKEVEYRMAQNILDFGTVGREQWLTATLALINTPYSVWTTLVAPAVGLVPQLANTRVAVFWGVSVLTAPNPVSLLSLRQGPTLASPVSTKATFNLEDLESQLTMEGYFSEPVTYDPNDWMNVVVTSKIATGAQAAVVLNCYIAGRKGEVTS
jgi:hypothetical protein